MGPLDLDSQATSCLTSPSFGQLYPAPRRQAYCPGIYADSKDSAANPPAPETETPSEKMPNSLCPTDKVTQMRLRIKPIKELRQSEDSQPEATPVQPCITRQPQERLASIMNFLEEVEESSKADMSSLLSSRSTRYPGSLDPSDIDLPERPPRIPSGLTQDAAAIHSRASMMEVEIHDKKQIIDSLKRALQESQEHEKKSMKDMEKEWEEKLHKQKTHYEAGLERHLRLVDRLLNDKTELTKRCELFSEELKAVERKFQMKMEEMDDHAAKELAKNKQNWIATERMKREAWEKEKVKEIKEMTIKGLQPEVERILSEKKQDKIRMEEQQREALDEQRRELLDMTQQQIRELREEKNREMETALDKEREAHRKKLREEFERFNREMQEERAKCAADLLAERRLREELLRQGAEGSEAKLREALAAERAKCQAAVQDAETRLAESTQQHQQQLLQLEHLLREEAHESERLANDKFRAQLEQHEATIRKELSAERDRQLEIVMERLSREHVERQLAAEAESNAKIQAARASAGEEAARLAKQLDECQAEVAALKAEKQQNEEIVRNLKNLQAADAARLADLQRTCSDLERERSELAAANDKVAEKLQHELRKLDEAKEKELEDMREDLGAALVQVKEEQAKLQGMEEESKKREEQIINDLEAKVKRTLQAKDETIGELRKRCAALDNKVQEFNYLLERQREELLGGLVRDLRR